MKSFIKWVVAFVAIVAISTLATCCAIKFLGHKILPQTYDSAVVTAQLDEHSSFEELKSLTDVFQLRQVMMDESRIDSTFLAIDDGPLSNVVAVLLKRNGITTKDDIVNEYIAGRAVYDNLPPGSTVQTDATTSNSIDNIANLSLEKVDNTTVTEVPSTSVGSVESPPIKDTVINGKRYKPVNLRIMKQAIIIMYDGSTPGHTVLKDAIGAIAQYGIIANLDKVEVYNLNEKEIMQAIVNKVAVAVVEAPDNTVSNYEEALKYLCDYNSITESIKNKDYESLSLCLGLSLAYDIANRPGSQLVEYTKIIAREGSESNYSNKFMQSLGVTSKVIQVIRKTYYKVCQGRHVIIR